MEEQMMPEASQTDDVIKEVSQVTSQPTQGAEDVTVEYAGFWVRFAALFVDGLVLLIPNAILQGIFGKSFGNFLGYLLLWTYAIYMLNTRQATLGKMAVGIKVTTTDGGKPTLGKLALREIIGKLVNILTLSIGYLMVAFTGKKQGLHDMIADTVVVYDPARKRRKWLVVVGVVAALIIPVIGIITGIVLVSTSSARDKAHDNAIKAYMLSVAPSALLYADDNNNSLSGFKLDSYPNIPACTGTPVVNISKSGQELAIMTHSCSDPKKYYCMYENINGDGMGEIIEKDSAFAASGKSSCR